MTKSKDKSSDLPFFKTLIAVIHSLLKLYYCYLLFMTRLLWTQVKDHNSCMYVNVQKLKICIDHWILSVM